MKTRVLARTTVVNGSGTTPVDRGRRRRQYVRVDTLKERLQWVLDHKRDGNASRWSEDAGLNRIHVGKLLKREGTDKGSVEIGVINKLAAVSDVPAAWLAFGVGSADDDPPFGVVLLQLRRLPGLEDVVSRHPERWHTSTVARATMTTFQSDSSGVPMGGWERALDTLEGARTRAPSPSTSAADVTRATSRQVGRRPSLPKLK